MLQLTLHVPQLFIVSFNDGASSYDYVVSETDQ
jgi:hypothetical protein